MQHQTLTQQSITTVRPLPTGGFCPGPVPGGTMSRWNSRGCWAVPFLWDSDHAPFGDRAAAPAKREPNKRAVRLSESAALPAQQRAPISGHTSFSMHGAIALALAALTASSSSAQDF